MSLLGQTRKRVESILKNSKESRDSDTILLIQYLITYEGVSFEMKARDMFKIFLSKNMPTFETIRRCRQKIQSEGKYIGKRKKERKELEKYYSRFFKK